MVLQRDNFWWEDRSCLAAEVQKKTVAPICEHESAATASTTAVPETTTVFTCPSGWVEFADRCYLVDFTTLKTWSSAEADCGSKGGHLASVHSGFQGDFLYNITASWTDPVWLGATDAISEVLTHCFAF